MEDQQDFNSRIEKRFKELPLVVQRAITSADLEKRLRALADSHKLHLDQWQGLENLVMLTVLGFSPVETLEKNIEKDVGVTPDIARDLVLNINTIVFEPIRQELERELSHPESKEAATNAIDASREQILKAEKTPSPTPPAPKPDGDVQRTPASGAYKPGEPSSARASVVDDPYRESPK